MGQRRLTCLLRRGLGGSGGVTAILLIWLVGGIPCAERGRLLGEVGLNTVKFLAGLKLISSFCGYVPPTPFIIAIGGTCWLDVGGLICAGCWDSLAANLGGRSLLCWPAVK